MKDGMLQNLLHKASKKSHQAHRRIKERHGTPNYQIKDRVWETIYTTQSITAEGIQISYDDSLMCVFCISRTTTWIALWNLHARILFMCRSLLWFQIQWLWDCWRSFLHSLTLYKNAADYALCKDTFYVESFNNTCLVYLDKRIHYKTPTYIMRINLAVLSWNEHADRPYTSRWNRLQVQHNRRALGKKITSQNHITL